jgi:hypothetical protein
MKRDTMSFSILDTVFIKNVLNLEPSNKRGHLNIEQQRARECPTAAAI